ncbi:MAG: tetratricopeptide repeat protein [Verrucomicrobiota bacterium]
MCLLLAAAALAAFWPALRCGFVDFDDGVYVTENPDIQHGLTWPSVQWAFTATHAGYWLPLTWLSHMADYQCYGLQPAGHHLTSLLWHAANSVLLFLVLKRLTGAFWRSALVAALFSLHPLRVESVAWVSERKDVLSMFFGLLTIWCYARYAEEFKAEGSKFKVFYAAALVLFALGLMAKPMLVTLPFVLLLLDYWPLRRFQFDAPFSWRLLREKIPFLVLAFGFSVITFLAQNSSGAVKSLSRYSLGQRLANVPVSYVRYLGKIFWPENLVAFYPQQRWHWWEVAATTGLLALASGWALWQWRRRPYLAVGWFWFLGTMVPTIGVVQSGDQAMADRFSYFPCVGLLIMVVWGMHELAARRPFFLNGLILGSGLAVMACAVLTSRQIRYWKDSTVLFSRAVDATGRNYLASYSLGCIALAEGNYPKAVEYFEDSLYAESGDVTWANPAPAHNNLGYALLREGHVAQAVEHFEKALVSKPAYPEAYYNLGCAFLTNRQPDVAIDAFQHGLAIDPNVADINYSLGETLLEQGRPSEATPYLEKALQIRPAFARAHYQLANALVRQARLTEAMAHYRRARELALARGDRVLAAAAEGPLRQYQSDAHPRPPDGARGK